MGTTRTAAFAWPSLANDSRNGGAQYAVGIDGQAASFGGRPSPLHATARPDAVPGSRLRRGGGFPFPIPMPGGGGTRPGGGGGMRVGDAIAVNVVAPREITDDSGGRTEIVRDPRDLDLATASIADELSRQVLPRISEPRISRRPLAHDSRRRSPSRVDRARAQGVYRHVVTGDPVNTTKQKGGCEPPFPPVARHPHVTEDIHTQRHRATSPV